MPKLPAAPPTPDEFVLLQLRSPPGAALTPPTVRPLGPPGLFPSLDLRAGELRQFQYQSHRAVFLVAAGRTLYFPPPERAPLTVLSGLHAVPLPVASAPPRWGDLATQDLAPLLLVQLQRLDALPHEQAGQMLAVLERLAGHTGYGSHDLELPFVARTPAEHEALLDAVAGRTPNAEARLEEPLSFDAAARELFAWSRGPRTEHLALTERHTTHDGQSGGSTSELCLLRLQVGRTRWRLERQLVRREIIDGMEYS